MAVDRRPRALLAPLLPAFLLLGGLARAEPVVEAARLVIDQPSVAVQIGEPVLGSATAGMLAGREAIALPVHGVHPTSGQQMQGTIHIAFLPEGQALVAVEMGPSADYRSARAAFDIIRNSIRLR